jgi:general secretion pathway protein N
MRMKRGTRLGIAALAGAAGLLALLNLDLLRSPIDTSPIASPADKADAPRPDSTALTTALDTKTLEQFQDTVGRPLFNPGRRPVQRKGPAAAAPEEASHLRLIGVLKLGKEPPRALLRSADKRTGEWIAEGAAFNGWTLRKVNERSVIMQSGKRSQELTLSTPRRAPDEPPGPKP